MNSGEVAADAILVGAHVLDSRATLEWVGPHSHSTPAPA